MRRVLCLAGVCVFAAVALAPAAIAGTPGTVANLRGQVTRLLTAELAKDTGTVCAIVAHPASTCAQHWDRSLTRFLRRGGRHMLKADMAAVAGAGVSSNGFWATIALPHPLLGGHSDFSWYDNCWMLEK
jgi:hypothetical protein